MVGNQTKPKECVNRLILQFLSLYSLKGLLVKSWVLTHCLRSFYSSSIENLCLMKMCEQRVHLWHCNQREQLRKAEFVERIMYSLHNLCCFSLRRNGESLRPPYFKSRLKVLWVDKSTKIRNKIRKRFTYLQGRDRIYECLYLFQVEVLFLIPLLSDVAPTRIELIYVKLSEVSDNGLEHNVSSFC